MKQIVLCVALFISAFTIEAQQSTNKIFWKEDFSKGVLPEG